MTLTCFDNQLKELERVRSRRCCFPVEKYKHDMWTPKKEKAAAANFLANLERQFDWIPNESEYVLLS